MIKKNNRIIITNKYRIANDYKSIFEEILNRPENRTTVEVNITAKEFLANQRYKKYNWK